MRKTTTIVVDLPLYAVQHLPGRWLLRAPAAATDPCGPAVRVVAGIIEENYSGDVMKPIMPTRPHMTRGEIDNLDWRSSLLEAARLPRRTC